MLGVSLSYLPERDLLVLLLGKEAYHAYYEYLDLPYIRDNYKELANIYVALQEAHKLVEADLTIADLQAYFFSRYPDADKGVYQSLFKTLSEASITPDLGVGLLKQIKARKQALSLSEAYFKFSTGAIDVDTLAGVEESVKRDSPDGIPDDADEFVTTSLSSIITDIFHKPGLRWRLDALNKSMGSLRKGNFGFLFARPETGKTTFLASEISHMLTQLKEGDGSVIWFNNEQVGAEVMMRMYQGYFGLRLEQLKANPKKYEEEFNKQTQGRFLLVDDAQLDRQKVERICKRYNPSLIVFDQIDKIKGFANDREDLRLGAIYIWARS